MFRFFVVFLLFSYLTLSFRPDEQWLQKHRTADLHWNFGLDVSFSDMGTSDCVYCMNGVCDNGPQGAKNIFSDFLVLLKNQNILL